MLGKLGKTINKANKWMGKSIPKAINFIDKANQWVGKEISKGKALYGTIKKDIIENAGILRPIVREAIGDLEMSPVGLIVSQGIKEVEMRQKQLGDIIHSGKTVSKFMGL